jgi:8-oxo-dGTP pyrophosphatase MutT (NUDIX family)
MSKELHGQFTISQGAVIENQRGEVLILKLAGGGWGIPGGHLHANEDWLVGLKREIFEETGISDVTVNGIGGVSLWKSNYGVWFRCEVAVHNSAIVLSDEHTDFAWITSVEDVERYSFCHPAIKDSVLKMFATK